MDNREVSEEEYRAAHNIWDEYEKKTVAYDKCFLMLDGNIRENLDKAMAELMYGEDLLAYWRVLSNQQPFVSTDEDGVVYSYQFVFRGMKRIHKNGIYEGSNGASNTSYHRLTELSKEGYYTRNNCGYGLLWRLF